MFKLSLSQAAWIVLILLNFSVARAEYDEPEETAIDDPNEITAYVEDHIDEMVGRISLSEPTDDMGQWLSQAAGTYGERTDAEAVFAAYDPTDDMDLFRQDSGYTRNGMENTLATSHAVDPYVQGLFRRYAQFRDQKGIELPADFSDLVHFIKGYIIANAKPDSEKVNGMSHLSLAVQIVRASFCFGNDPFMIASKMRRETSFRRVSVSPTGAVGFSQMTGDGIAEVQDQMTAGGQRMVRGKSRVVSMPNARNEFLQAIRCFTGLESNQWTFPSGTNEQIKARLSDKWTWDMIFGQTMIKAIVSWAKASGSYPNTFEGNKRAYRETFARYNGDDNPTTAICMRTEAVAQQTEQQRRDKVVPMVPMRDEYACNSIEHFQRMSNQWKAFQKRKTGRDVSWLVPAKGSDAVCRF